MKRLCLLLILILATFAGCVAPQSRTPDRSVTYATTQVFDGYVVAVLDGDTFDVMPDGYKTTLRIRIRGIDAPEKAQAFGTISRDHLAALIHNRQVRVLSDGTDRYGRTLGKVLMLDNDVGLHMIETGLAWHFKRYLLSQPLEERIAYAAAEVRARESRLGLWSDPAPTAPWSFRKDKRK